MIYVGPETQDFLSSIEEREKPGTPGILQILRAALAMQVRDRVGLDRIRELEDTYLREAMERLQRNPRIEILGNPDPARRIGIVSFNIREGDRHLHPRFVTRLLCDLFGIQTRAGCSCAGPYGHRLLGIGQPESERYRAAIHQGCSAVKPGWVRFNVHYTMTGEELEYLLACIEFVARHGSRFLALYECALETGAWSPRGWSDPAVPFGLDEALAYRGVGSGERSAAGRSAPSGALGEGDAFAFSPMGREAVLDDEARRALRRQALEEARTLAAKLADSPLWVRLPAELEALSFFHCAHVRR